MPKVSYIVGKFQMAMSRFHLCHCPRWQFDSGEQTWRNSVGLGIQRWCRVLKQKCRGHFTLGILGQIKMAGIKAVSSPPEQDQDLRLYAPKCHAARGSERLKQPRRCSARPLQVPPRPNKREAIQRCQKTPFLGFPIVACLG